MVFGVMLISVVLDVEVLIVCMCWRVWIIG